MKYMMLFASIYGVLQSPCLAMEDEPTSHLSRTQHPSRSQAPANVETGKDEWPHLSQTLRTLQLVDKSNELANKCEALANQIQCGQKFSPKELIEFEIRKSILENQLNIIKNQSNIISLQVELVEEHIRQIEKKE